MVATDEEAAAGGGVAVRGKDGRERGAAERGRECVGGNVAAESVRGVCVRGGDRAGDDIESRIPSGATNRSECQLSTFRPEAGTSCD